jgi:aquaporin Z
VARRSWSSGAGVDKGGGGETPVKLLHRTGMDRRPHARSSAPDADPYIDRPSDRFRDHLPEYLLEGLGLGLFMVAAATFAVLLEASGSPARALVADPFARRALMGIAMGLTAFALICSPIGQRSGAHLNPATTLTFMRLGKVAPRDAVGYVAGQFLGGTIGLGAAALLFGPVLGSPEVRFVATVPGPWGVGAAFAAELAISFVLMSVVLRVSQSRRWNRFTGACAGTLVATWITFEAPVSGMSMNPARTFASALLAQDFTAFWLYCAAPSLGMLLAAEVFVRQRGLAAVLCAKLHHQNAHRCIFRCAFGMAAKPEGAPAASKLARSACNTTTSS